MRRRTVRNSPTEIGSAVEPCHAECSRIPAGFQPEPILLACKSSRRLISVRPPERPPPTTTRSYVLKLCGMSCFRDEALTAVPQTQIANLLGHIRHVVVCQTGENG